MTKEEIDKLAKSLAEIGGCPCNYSPLDEDMQRYCFACYADENDDGCTMDEKECWCRFIEKEITK